MIKVNNKDFQWKENMSIEYLLKILENTHEFSYIHKEVPIIFYLNNNVIQPSEYRKVLITEEDQIRIVPMIVGG